MTWFSQKVQKPCFWAIFWPFLVIFAWWGFFPKNPALSHITIYEPLTPCFISEKTNEPILRKLTARSKDEWKDRQKDGQTLFYRTYPAEVGGDPTRKSLKIVHPYVSAYLELYNSKVLMVRYLKNRIGFPWNIWTLINFWKLTRLSHNKNRSLF